MLTVPTARIFLRQSALFGNQIFLLGPAFASHKILFFRRANFPVAVFKNPSKVPRRAGHHNSKLQVWPEIHTPFVQRERHFRRTSR